MPAVGVSGPLAGVATSHCLQGMASFTRTELEGSATLANLELDIRRGRLVMVESRVRDLPENSGGGIRHHGPATGWPVGGQRAMRYFMITPQAMRGPAAPAGSVM